MGKRSSLSIVQMCCSIYMSLVLSREFVRMLQSSVDTVDQTKGIP